MTANFPVKNPAVKAAEPSVIVCGNRPILGAQVGIFGIRKNLASFHRVT